MSRKKVGLYLGGIPSGGGTFQYNQTMLEAVVKLPKEHFEIVVAYSHPRWLEYINQFDILSIHNPRPIISRIISFTCRNLRVPILAWQKIHSKLDPFAQRLIAEACDLWIFPSQDLFSYTIDIPSIGTIHDLMHRYETQFEELSKNGEYNSREFHYSNMVRYAKGVIVDSNIGKIQVQESYDVVESKVHVLPFTAPGYIFSRQTPNDFDKKYELPSKFIFYPAQFWHHKNHEGLVRALALSKQKNPNIKLVLVGSKKNAYDHVVRLVEVLGLSGAVHFMGYVPDSYMPEFYRRARAVVMPSFCGPTNIPPLEAFATNCPLAVSNVYGMPDQVGDAALLFDPRSIADIANVLDKLWQDDQLCKMLIKKGRQRSEMFGASSFQKRLSEIIDSI